MHANPHESSLNNPFVFQTLISKIQDYCKILSGRLQIVNGLGTMSISDQTTALNFQNDFILDKDISDIITDLFSFEKNRYGNLLFSRNFFPAK